MTLPNLISIARLFLVPVIVVMILNERWAEACLVFVIAGLSDALDGYLAKHRGMASELGGYLDPIADKALIVSIYVTLAVIRELPVWLVVLVVARDVMIVAAVLLSWVMGRPLAMAPFVVSKLNTAAQILLAALVLGARGFGLEAAMPILLGQILVAALTLGSVAAYLAFWLRHMAGDAAP